MFASLLKAMCLLEVESPMIPHGMLLNVAIYQPVNTLGVPMQLFRVYNLIIRQHLSLLLLPVGYTMLPLLFVSMTIVSLGVLKYMESNCGIEGGFVCI